MKDPREKNISTNRETQASTPLSRSSGMVFLIALLYFVFPTMLSAACITFYEDSNYGGPSFEDCDTGYAVMPSGWIDEVSSLKVDKGYKVTLFFKSDFKFKARTYFKDTPDIGVHDEASSYRIQRFNENRFVMAFASDPQYGITETPHFASNHATANAYHRNSLNELIAETGDDFAGIVVNGDMTNVADRGQILNFRSGYIAGDWNLYIGFGNHEVQYTSGKDCDTDLLEVEYCQGWFLSNYGLDLMASAGHDYDFQWDRVYFSTGSYIKSSLFHSWDIGTYNFIQLNERPGRTFKHTPGWTRNGLELTTSWDQLTAHLSALDADKKIIINLHEYYEDRADLTEVLENSGRGDDVVAIFAGHKHERAGQKKVSETQWNSASNKARFYTINGRKVPVFFSGSSFYNKYLRVEFTEGSMQVDVIHSAPLTAGGSHLHYTGDSYVEMVDNDLSTGWLNRDTPGGAGNHDWEKLAQHAGNIDSSYYGIEPAYVEMRRVSDGVDIAEVSPSPTRALSTRYGGKVLNYNGTESDYEIQFHYGWTPWLDASSTGDLSNEHERWTDWADEEVASSVRGRMPNRPPAISLCRDKFDPDSETREIESCPGSQTQVRYYFGYEPLCAGNTKDATDNGKCDWSYVSFDNKRIYNGYSGNMSYGVDAVGVNPTNKGTNIEIYNASHSGGIEKWSYDQADGKIYAGWDSDRCFDVPGGSSDFHNGSSVQLWDCDRTDEKWDFNPFDGKFRLRGTSYCLDVAGTNRTENKVNLLIWNCNGVTETWRIDDMDTYSIMARWSGDHCVDLSGVNLTSNYRSIQIYDCDDVSEKWIYLPTSGELRASFATNICWDVRGDNPSGTGFSTRFQSAPCHYGNVWEAWDYDRAAGKLEIRHRPGLCSAMNGSSTIDGARMVQDNCTHSESFDMLYE